MKVVLDNAVLPGSVKQPVQLGVPFSLELTVSPERPGVSGAEGVTFKCIAPGFTIAPPRVTIDIPLGKKSLTKTVQVTLKSGSHVEPAVVDIEASAGKTVYTVPVMTRK